MREERPVHSRGEPTADVFEDRRQDEPQGWAAALPLQEVAPAAQSSFAEVRSTSAVNSSTKTSRLPSEAAAPAKQRAKAARLRSEALRVWKGRSRS